MPATVSRWRLSFATYYFDFVMVPLFVITAFWIAMPFTQQMLIAVCYGFAAWTLAEYLIHRILFHHRTPFNVQGEHLIHHRSPIDYIGVPPWQTAIVLCDVWVLLWFAFGKHCGSAAFAGLAAGYFAYIVLHDGHHHHERTGFYRRYMGRLHDLHHANSRVNFGVSSPLWDLIFRTYRAPG